MIGLGLFTVGEVLYLLLDMGSEMRRWLLSWDLISTILIIALIPVFLMPIVFAESIPIKGTDDAQKKDDAAAAHHPPPPTEPSEPK